MKNSRDDDSWIDGCLRVNHIVFFWTPVCGIVDAVSHVSVVVQNDVARCPKMLNMSHSWRQRDLPHPVMFVRSIVPLTAEVLW